MDLNINYDETISVGNQVNEKGNEFKEVLTTIRNINNELQGYWEGSDATKYTNAVAEQAAYMDELAKTINQMGDFLIKVGNAYKEVSENNANAIK